MSPSVFVLTVAVILLALNAVRSERSVRSLRQHAVRLISEAVMRHELRELDGAKDAARDVETTKTGPQLRVTQERLCDEGPCQHATNADQ